EPRGPLLGPGERPRGDALEEDAEPGGRAALGRDPERDARPREEPGDARQRPAQPVSERARIPRDENFALERHRPRSAARRRGLPVGPALLRRRGGLALQPLDVDLARLLGGDEPLADELLDDLLVALLVLVGEGVLVALVLDDDVLLA